MVNLLGDELAGGTGGIGVFGSAPGSATITCAMNAATYGTAPADAGVASAMVNTNQQIGGSIGTALLDTIAASALASYVVAHSHGPLAHSPLLEAQGAVHSYVVAFWVSAGIFAASSLPMFRCAFSISLGTRLSHWFRDTSMNSGAARVSRKTRSVSPVFSM